MIAVSPSLFRAWRFWASSVHPREAENESFLACAARTKQRLEAAHTRPCTPSLSSMYNRGCQPGVARDAALFRSERKHRRYVRNAYCIMYCFPTGRKFSRFHQIESNSISSVHNKWNCFDSKVSFLRASIKEECIVNRIDSNRLFFYESTFVEK